MANIFEQLVRPVRREVFISYHHTGDQAYFDRFSAAFHDQLRLITDNSLERRIESADTAYVMRRIRDSHLTGSSCTIVLCGAATWRRKYVDWEVKASLDQKMGLVGIRLPSLFDAPALRPQRLHDNVASGYAVWAQWSDIVADHHHLVRCIEDALTRPTSAIVNSRSLMIDNL